MHFCKMSQQEHQHIIVTSSNYNTKCLAPDAVWYYMSVSFLMTLLQFMNVDIRGGRLHQFCVTNFSSDNNSFVCWCP